MKKFLFVAIAAVLALGVVTVQADTTNTYTNAVGQIVTVITKVTGSTVSVEPKALSVSQPSRTRVAPQGAQLSASNPVVPTVYTPRDAGDVLVGYVDGSVFVAKGTAVTDWVRVSNSAQATSAEPHTVTDYTPRFVGDILVSAASNKVYVSKGVTTNDWLTVK